MGSSDLPEGMGGGESTTSRHSEATERIKEKISDIKIETKKGERKIEGGHGMEFFGERS